MTPEERRDHCRAIAASGGKKTVERYGTEHMQVIGRRGFRVAVDLGWGPELAKKLGRSYEQKFGRPLVLGPVSQRKAALRREARAIYAGGPCDVSGCEAAAQVHHMAGLDVAGPNDAGSIRLLCAQHHRELHQRMRRARRLGVRA